MNYQSEDRLCKTGFLSASFHHVDNLGLRNLCIKHNTAGFIELIINFQ